MSGKKLHSLHFLLYVAGRREGISRLGLTVSKKVGGAVQRNRVKRLLREFFRTYCLQMPYFADISIIAKPGAAELSYRQVCAELIPLLMPAGRGAA